MKKNRKQSQKVEVVEVTAEPVENMDESVDFKKEEQELEAAIAELKKKKKALVLRKKQATGGKKLSHKVAYAQNTTQWAVNVAAKLYRTLRTANKAVAGLIEYEEKLGVSAKHAIGEPLATRLSGITEVTESMDAIKEVMQKVKELDSDQKKKDSGK
ncbi:hypothetical protein KAR91_32485 [Candidatus Pacearchaeota archaeon]|nr:hypothetical protein [Candidatus Pacearchaeota archaeon]